MAALTEADRVEIWAQFQREISDARETAPFLKADLRAAVNAVDDWVNANASAFNTALPQPFRGAATTSQKARLLAWVVKQRFIRGL